MANTDAKWNEQAFLLDFYKQWLHLNRDKKYNNFVQITGDPSALVNKIYSEGSLNDFSKITTAQASMLIPHIELFKVVYPEKNKESGKKLYGDTSMEINLPFSLNSQAGEFKTGDILASRLARGSAVGLKNVSWEDLGTTPADSGFSFKVNLSLFFQSMDALFREWSTTGLLNGKRETVKTAWADLVTPSGELKNPQKADIGMDADTGKIPYHDKDFLIKLAVGWSVPQDPGNAVFSPKDKRILEAIKRQRISYILSLNDHSINLNADGTVELDLTYLARIEGRMLNSANADLLYIEDGSPLVKVVDVIKRTVEQIKKDERKIGAEATKKRKAANQQMADEYTGVLVGGGTLSSGEGQRELTKVNQKEAKELESLSVRKKVQEKLLREARYEQKAQSYRRIMKQIEESARIYQIAVTPKMVEAWVASMDRATDKKTVEERNEEILKKRTNSKNVVNKSLEGQNINERKGKFDNLELNREFIEAAALDGEDGTIKRQAALNKYFEARKADDIPEDGETYVSFFFFGDLLEAAINVVLEGKQGRYNLLGDGNKRKIDKSDFDFLLGPIEMFEYFEGDRVEVTSVPLCDIPISTKLFGMWFAKNIIKPMRETLTLKQFLRMVAAELVQGMLAPPIYGPIGAKQKTKMSFNTFSLPTSKKNPFRSGAKDRNRIDIDKMTYPDFYNVFRSAAKTRDYFMMYFAGPISNQLTGDFVTDSKMGIPHFEIAQDRGIVKNINFSKVDIPGFREANIEKNEKASKRNLLYSNKYSAQVNTLGCPVFKPGMLTNINPRGFGIGKKSKYAQLGFGGYYTITKVSNNISNGSYETSLEMHYESPSPPINPTSYKISYQKSENLREMSDPSVGRETRATNAIISKFKSMVESPVENVIKPLVKPYENKTALETAIIAKQPLDEGGK